MLVSCRASDAAHLARFDYARISMGVEARVALYAENESAAIDAARAAFDRIDELDRELSDYMPESELSRLSSRSGGAAVEVGDDLFRVLERSIEFSRASDGAFDVSVGPLVALWRTARKSGALPDESSLAEARARVGWRSIELDRGRRSVRLAQSGMHLDVGGIGKGFACDEALAVLHAHGIDRCLVALAGDVRLGAAPPGREGWSVTASSGDNASEAEHLVLADCAISTSGDTEQFVEIGGARYSHIIDPRTGRALTSRIRVTVIARDGTSADALATAASELGIDAGLDLVARFDGADSMIVAITPDGTLRRSTRGFERHLAEGDTHRASAGFGSAAPRSDAVPNRNDDPRTSR
jgi:thiamine biosynthesis lipoprotein